MDAPANQAPPQLHPPNVVTHGAKKTKKNQTRQQWPKCKTWGFKTVAHETMLKSKTCLERRSGIISTGYITPSPLPHRCCPVHGESSKYQTDTGSRETRATDENVKPRHAPCVINTTELQMRCWKGCLNYETHHSSIMRHIQNSTRWKVTRELSQVVMITNLFLFFYPASLTDNKQLCVHEKLAVNVLTDSSFIWCTKSGMFPEKI